MNYEVLRHDKLYAVVKLNPAGYDAFLFGGPTEGTLSLTSSYSWKGVRIGRTKNQFQLTSSKTSHDEVRPVFLFGTEVDILHPSDPGFKEAWAEASVAFQAGPTLVWDSKVDIRSIDQKFKSDAIRRTQHAAIGITKAGKIIALYATNASMLQLAEELIRWGCVKGMKCDGGHMAHLHLKPEQEDKKPLPISIGPYRIPAGICFKPKPRQ